MADATIEIHGFSDVEYKWTVNFGMKRDHSFQDDRKLIAFVTQQVFEFVHRTSMQLHKYWTEALAHKVVGKISISIDARIDDEAFLSTLDTAATDVHVSQGAIFPRREKPRYVDRQCVGKLHQLVVCQRSLAVLDFRPCRN